jgi:hypothetical protein
MPQVPAETTPAELSGQADNEGFNFGLDSGPARRTTKSGAVEFAGDEPPVPGEEGLGIGDTGHHLERGPAEPIADLSKGGSLAIGKAHTGGKGCSQDPIFGDQIFDLEQEFLIDQPGDAGQQPRPFVVLHEQHPSQNSPLRF